MARESGPESPMVQSGRGASEQAMYGFSRAIYRELAPHLEGGEDHREACAKVLAACERVVERLALDRHYFAHPTRTLFNDIRGHFPVSAQARVLAVVERYLAYADEYVTRLQREGRDPAGRPAPCRATTRKGTPCARTPLPHNGYCPSHQHLTETEYVEAGPVAA